MKKLVNILAPCHYWITENFSVTGVFDRVLSSFHHYYHLCHHYFHHHCRWLHHFWLDFSIFAPDSLFIELSTGVCYKMNGDAMLPVLRGVTLFDYDGSCKRYSCGISSLKANHYQKNLPIFSLESIISPQSNLRSNYLDQLWLRKFRVAKVGQNQWKLRTKALMVVWEK